MLKKEIKHKDIDNNDTTTIAYFNLTKAEALEVNIRTDIALIAETRNINDTMDAFNRIMRASYGVRTPDGQFLKIRPEGGHYFDQFATTEAYSELFIELFGNPDTASDFIKNILPPEINGQESQSKAIPDHMANHPSMQGRRAKVEVDRSEAPQQSQYEIHNAKEAEKEELRRQIRAELEEEMRPSERVSPPEDTQPYQPVRDDLV